MGLPTAWWTVSIGRVSAVARRVATHERRFRSWQEMKVARRSSRSTTILCRIDPAMIACWIVASTRESVGRGAEDVLDESAECCEGTVDMVERAVEVVERAAQKACETGGTERSPAEKRRTWFINSRGPPGDLLPPVFVVELVYINRGEARRGA